MDQAPQDNVGVAVDGRIGHLTLDRPEAINALTPAMVNRLLSALQTWRYDPGIEIILLDGNGPKGFCAGGDIKLVYRSATRDCQEALAFWREEYQLVATLADYPKPIVSVAHGITMGGGVGVASHTSHRVVTPDVRLAMPETKIGLSPDVAGLYLLGKAPGDTGTHAALTGQTFGSGDAMAMGFADAVIPTSRLNELTAALQERGPDEALALLNQPAVSRPACLTTQQDWINTCYTPGRDLNQIITALARHPNPAARDAARALRGVSPTAAHVSLAAIRRAREMTSVQECLRQDFRVITRFVHHHDLIEGIRAKVIDKDDAPHWDPTSPDRVQGRDVQAFFAPFDDQDSDLHLGMEPHDSTPVEGAPTRQWR